MSVEWVDALKPISAILSDYWRSSRWTLASVAFIVALSSLTSVAAPYVFSQLIDRLPSARDYESLLLVSFIYAGLLGVATILRHAVRYLTFLTSENLNFVSGVAFFERILKKTTNFFVDHNSAEIQSAQSRGQAALNAFVQLALASIIPNLVQIGLTIAAVGAVINAEIATIVFVYGAAFIAFTYFANRWTSQHLNEAIGSVQENAKFVGNAMHAMETLRLFESDQWLKIRFSQQSGDVRDNWRRFSLKRIGYASFYGIALAIQFALTFALLLPQYREGKLTIGDVVLFNTLLLQLNQPFEMVGQAIDNLIRSYSQFLPFARMWLAPEEVDAVETEPLIVPNGRISFEGVSYVYANGRGVKNVTFYAERGRLTFLTGQTGSGKSTIFRLLLKSLTPAEGRILIDGIDLNEVSRNSWLSKIGVVPQDILLLNESLKTNFVLGRSLDETRLRNAARKAAILDFIEALPEGFDTVVGERGLKLSGGERQRIAIARALYSEPQFLFLDEASSALDNATEREIMSQVRRIANEVTVLAITHRKTVIAEDDCVIFLQNGLTASAQ